MLPNKALQLTGHNAPSRKWYARRHWNWTAPAGSEAAPQLSARSVRRQRETVNSATRFIVAAGGLGSATIALLQPIIYLGGPTIYRAFGAPPRIAEMRAADPLQMAFWSLFWFVLFLAFAFYALSAVGLVRRAPFLRSGLLAIAIIYVVRGLAIVPQLIWFNALPVTRVRDVAFSGISLLLAASYATAVQQLARSVAA